MCITGMVPPLEHPKKEVRKVLKQARAAGWSVVRSKGRSGHSWGAVVCPSGTCRVRLPGTPRVPQDLADKVKRSIAKCTCASTLKEGT